MYNLAIRKCTSPPLLAPRLKIFKWKFTTPPGIEPRTCWTRCMYISGFRACLHLRSLAPLMNDDNDGQMIFGDLAGLKLSDICLTWEEKTPKNLTQETFPYRGSNPGPPRDKRACYHLLHSAEPEADMLPSEPARWYYNFISHLSIPSECSVNCTWLWWGRRCTVLKNCSQKARNLPRFRLC